MFTTAGYVIALCKLVDGLPNRTGEAREIIAQFGRAYRSEIPRHHFEIDASGALAWDKQVQWCRHRAVTLGWMDSPARGIWRVTNKGHEWLAANPNATHIPRLPANVSRQKTVHVTPASIPRTAKETTLRRQTRSQENHNYQQQLLFQKIQEVENFLDGRTASRPSDEQLCDWINLCYAFEMYAQGAELFRLVARENVNEWYFERTRKLAKICALRAVPSN